MLNRENITALRMERQFLHRKADKEEYNCLFRDLQPGQNVYWHGFGDPPSISFRADFDDIEYNRQRQQSRELVKGRFQGGTLGWIEQKDLELFAGLTMKPLTKPTPDQMELLTLIEQEGPLTIQSMKQQTGMLVKKITPALHRLQEAFLIYEDQYNGEWDRGWYRFAEMFPDIDTGRYTRHEALKVILQRFAFRAVFFTPKMAKAFYRLPEKDIKTALGELVNEGTLVLYEDGYLLQSDRKLLEKEDFTGAESIFVMHRNDFLVKIYEEELKARYKDGENDILQYILVDGEFCGALLGKFKYGPYIMENLVYERSDRMQAVMEAVYEVNGNENPIQRLNGAPVNNGQA